MFATGAVAIEEGRDATRVVWLKGSPGNLHVAQSLELTDDRSPAAVVKAMKGKRIPTRGVTFGVGGQGASLRYSLVPPVPDWRLELIMKYEADELIEKSGDPLSSDWRQLDIPESDADDLILLTGLSKDNLVQPRLEEFDSVGAGPTLAIPHALAIYHAYRQCIKGVPRETVLLADLGSRESHVALVSDGRLIFARSVRFGGDQVDENLADAMSLDVAKGRTLKHKLGDGTLPQDLVDSAQSSLRSSFGQFVSMLQSSITFCKAQTKIRELDVDRVLVSGGTARLPGLIQYLGDSMRIPVQIHEPQIAGDLPGDAACWVTAVGLAAAGFDPGRVYLDLLPAQAKGKREFRERTVYLYAAAAVLIVAVLVNLVTAIKANSNYSALTKKLKSNESSVRGWQAEQQAAESHNALIGSQVARVERAVFDSSFPTRFLDSVQRLIPASIELESFTTDRNEIDGKVYLTIELNGRSSDAERKGLAVLSQFENALENIPGVRWVKPDQQGFEDGYYPFSIIVSPDEPAPRSAAGRRTRSSGRRS